MAFLPYSSVSQSGVRLSLVDMRDSDSYLNELNHFVVKYSCYLLSLVSCVCCVLVLKLKLSTSCGVSSVFNVALAGKQANDNFPSSNSVSSLLLC